MSLSVFAGLPKDIIQYEVFQFAGLVIRPGNCVMRLLEKHRVRAMDFLFRRARVYNALEGWSDYWDGVSLIHSYRLHYSESMTMVLAASVMAQNPKRFFRCTIVKPEMHYSEQFVLNSVQPSDAFFGGWIWDGYNPSIAMWKWSTFSNEWEKYDPNFELSSDSESDSEFA